MGYADEQLSLTLAPLGNILPEKRIDMLSFDSLKSTVRKPRMSSMAELRAAYAVFLEAWAYVSTSDDDGKTH
jgi:hypothetical protein